MQSLLFANKEVQKAMEANHFDTTKLINNTIDLLGATTLAKDGLTPVADNLARVRAAELLADMLKLRGGDTQQLSTLRLLMDALGLRKTAPTVVVQNFTQQLYDRYHTANPLKLPPVQGEGQG